MNSKFLVGDVFEQLATIPDDSVDLIFTSPPFMNLRSYLPPEHPDKAKEIGTEGTPAAFVQTMLEVVEACERVLAPHGSLVFELGDTYAGSGGSGGDYDEGGWREGQPTWKQKPLSMRPKYAGVGGEDGRRNRAEDEAAGILQARRRPGPSGRDAIEGWPLDKSICGIPWLFSLSLAWGRNLLGAPCTLCDGERGYLGNAITQHSRWIDCPACGGDGQRRIDPWRIRNVVAWCRPNPPVGALGDKFRPATSFLTVACKARDRYFDLDAVRTPNKQQGDFAPWVDTRSAEVEMVEGWKGGGPHNGGNNPAGTPPYDFWVIPTGRYEGAHYATFPEDLVVVPVKAMCPESVCITCGEPQRRIVERQSAGVGFRKSRENRLDQPKSTGFYESHRTTVGWTDCGHDAWRRGVVLDPFAGSGTTLAVATGHGRDSIGIDLDERNAELAQRRVGMFLSVQAS